METTWPLPLPLFAAEVVKGKNAEAMSRMNESMFMATIWISNGGFSKE